jgi:hypothetical protein
MNEERGGGEGGGHLHTLALPIASSGTQNVAPPSAPRHLVVGIVISCQSAVNETGRAGLGGRSTSSGPLVTSHGVMSTPSTAPSHVAPPVHSHGAGSLLRAKGHRSAHARDPGQKLMTQCEKTRSGTEIE